MTILVVGGAGYIGSHVARALRNHGHEVIIYDNLSTGHAFLVRGFELIVADISDHQKLRDVLRRVDGVMHLAAHAYVGESVLNPRKYLGNNVAGGLALLNTTMDAGVRNFVFSSSCAVYGIPSKIPITEETPRQPVNPYGVSKLFFENALESYDRAYGLRYASLRYFNAAGADKEGEVGEVHDPETHLIPLALGAAARKSSELQIYGSDYPTSDGTCIRDYIHVSDLAEAHVLALQRIMRGGESFAINLGTGSGHSIREVVDMIEQVTGRPVPRRLVERRPGDPPALVADPTYAQRLLQWEAKRTLRDIIEDAWNWEQRRALGL